MEALKTLAEGFPDAHVPQRPVEESKLIEESQTKLLVE